jgi:hypothetical protein
MFVKNDLVLATSNNPLYILLDGEVGVVQGFYVKEDIQYISVLFTEYGSEQGYAPSSLYEKVEVFIEETSQEEEDRHRIIEATHFIQTQKIYAQSILNK